MQDEVIAKKVLLRYAAKNKEIPVKNKKLNEFVWVLPETIKENPGVYEKVGPDELKKVTNPKKAPKTPSGPNVPVRPRTPKKPKAPKSPLDKR